jgi:hypothetical protein
MPNDLTPEEQKKLNEISAFYKKELHKNYKNMKLTPNKARCESIQDFTYRFSQLSQSIVNSEEYVAKAKSEINVEVLGFDKAKGNCDITVSIPLKYFL